MLFQTCIFKAIYTVTLSLQSSESHQRPGPHSSLMRWPSSLSYRRHQLKACSHLRFIGAKIQLAQTNLILVIKTSHGLPPTRVLWVNLVITVCRLKACYWKPQRWVMKTAPYKIGSTVYQPDLQMTPRKGRKRKSGSKPNGFLTNLS